MLAGIRPGQSARLIAMLIAFVVLCLSVALGGSAVGASAAETTVSTSTTSEQSILVWVRTDADKVGVANVSVTVDGDSGTVTGVTGADGKAVVPVPEPGTFTVTIDEDALPAGTGYPRPSTNPATVEVYEGNTEVPAIFFLSPDNAKGATAAPTTEATTPATPAPGGTDETGTTTAPVTADTFWLRFWPQLVTGLIFGLLIALAAIGASLIYGTTGLNNFAHGELVTFGALMAYFFSGILGLPAVIAIPIAMILGGLFGWAQDAGIWRPLRKRGLGLIPMMIVTIGLSLALRYTFVLLFGPDRLTLPNSTKPFLVIGSVSLKFTDVAGAVIAIVVILSVAFVLTKTKIGKAMRAVADNRALASASGINVERVIRVVWVGSGALAALAGVYVGYYQSLRWDTGASILLLIFAAITLGGLGSAYGALVGAVAIGLIMNLSTLWIPENLKFVAPLVLMIIILLVRPQGILGRKERVG
ncbi:branched-chain amino acid ABC transporter permease [Agreia sp. COWG]|uniref:branched-chain amino acid ABC transporter permease n=1 Tax=Agreia sp. COWG TaxID=2773266 RepID=UPI001AFC4861|nr:branched-chain amino acid ABC transporter permease [Agreia sp. COWG]CAD6004197.1 Amino acid/amide ABC transporter membrane protein 1, HAAT family [Agreia sp. COWG]